MEPRACSVKDRHVQQSCQITKLRKVNEEHGASEATNTSIIFFVVGMFLSCLCWSHVVQDVHGAKHNAVHAILGNQT